MFFRFFYTAKKITYIIAHCTFSSVFTLFGDLQAEVASLRAASAALGPVDSECQPSLVYAKYTTISSNP